MSDPIRINAIPTTATAPSSDDYIAIDGATNGTRKLGATPYNLSKAAGVSIDSMTAVKTAGNNPHGTLYYPATDCFYISDAVNGYITKVSRNNICNVSTVATGTVSVPQICFAKGWIWAIACPSGGGGNAVILRVDPVSLAVTTAATLSTIRNDSPIIPSICTDGLSLFPVGRVPVTFPTRGRIERWTVNSDGTLTFSATLDLDINFSAAHACVVAGTPARVYVTSFPSGYIGQIDPVSMTLISSSILQSGTEKLGPTDDIVVDTCSDYCAQTGPNASATKLYIHSELSYGSGNFITEIPLATFGTPATWVYTRIPYTLGSYGGYVSGGNLYVCAVGVPSAQQIPSAGLLLALKLSDHTWTPVLYPVFGNFNELLLVNGVFFATTWPVSGKNGGNFYRLQSPSVPPASAAVINLGVFNNITPGHSNTGTIDISLGWSWIMNVGSDITLAIDRTNFPVLGIGNANGIVYVFFHTFQADPDLGPQTYTITPSGITGMVPLVLTEDLVLEKNYLIAFIVSDALTAPAEIFRKALD
jgi:hypothetical protein